MKKNLISILILALLVVNLVLTAILMFSVIGTAKKTNKLVTDISTALNLELTKDEGSQDSGEIQITDLVSVDIPDTLTIPLKPGEGEEKTHYCIINVTFFLNATHEDYETMGTVFEGNVSLNKSVIENIIGEHTLTEAQADKNALKAEILAAIQAEYKSTFIYRVEFSSIIFQ